MLCPVHRPVRALIRAIPVRNTGNGAFPPLKPTPALGQGRTLESAMTIRRFTGALAAPITIRTRRIELMTLSPEQRAEGEEYNRQQILDGIRRQFEKLDILAAECGIDPESPNKFALLAYQLATEFVPGLRIRDSATRQGPGRKTEWGLTRYVQLVEDVETIKAEKKCSDSQACKILRSRFDRWKPYNKRTLENRLVMARDPQKNPLFRMAGPAPHTNESTDQRGEKTVEDITTRLFGPITDLKT